MLHCIWWAELYISEKHVTKKSGADNGKQTKKPRDETPTGWQILTGNARSSALATLARQHCRRAAGSARPRLRCLGTSSSPDSSRGSLSANLISARARASLSGQLETGEPTLVGSQSKQSVWLWLQDTPESFRLRDDTSKHNCGRTVQIKPA